MTRRLPRRAARALALTLAATAALAAPPTDAAPGKRGQVAPREADPETLLVVPRAGAAARALDRGKSRRVAGTRFYELEVEATEAEATLRRLRADDDVAIVERNHLRRASAAPDDPLFAKARQPYLNTIRLPAGLDRQPDATGQVIAVLDTGVDADHPDLAGRTLPGRDLVDEDVDPHDLRGHGTAVAGVAAASTGNDLGIAGVAGGAKILPVRVLSAGGTGYDSDIAAGIVWAADQGADVINLSLGGPAPSRILADAVAHAHAKDAVVVAAAGNRGIRMAEYPAALPGVVAVTATDWGGELASFSNSGDWVDVAAPGWRMTMPTTRSGPREHYEIGDGTSYAAPVVAGLAALLRAQTPAAARTAVEDRIRTTATDLGPRGIDPGFGHGLVNVDAALGGPAAPAQVIPITDADGTPDRATLMPGFEDATVTRMNGEISPPGDVDWYAVDIANTGEHDIDVRDGYSSLDRPGELDAVWELYTPDHRFLWRSESELAYLELPVTGRYLLKVENRHPSRGAGGYEVQVTDGTFGDGGSGPVNPFVRDDRNYPIDSQTREPAVADVTGDGLPDVLVVTTTDSTFPTADDFALQVFPQTAEGWLDSPRRYGTGRHDGEAHLAVGDVTGDGRADAVVTTPAGVRLYRQAAAGGLGTGQLIAGTADALHVQVADADGDGDRDIVYSTRTDTSAPQGVFVLAASGSGALAARRRLTPMPVHEGFAVGRLNGDARPDLAVDTLDGLSAGSLMVLRRAADGTYAAQRLPYHAVDLEIADLTGDGRQDLVAIKDDVPGAAFEDMHTLVFAQSSGGALGAVTQRLEHDSFLLSVGDVDGDGRSDLGAGDYVFLQRAGRLTRMPDAQIPSPSAFNGGIVLADINGDGRADAVSTSNDRLVPARQLSPGWPRPLWVRDSTPAPDAAGVSTSAAPAIEFGRALDPASITDATVVLRDAVRGTAVAATRTYDAATRTVTVRPAGALAGGRTYTVTVGGVRDAGGRLMGHQPRTRLDDGAAYYPPWMVVEPFVLRFTVGAGAADTTPPDTLIVSGPQGTLATTDEEWDYASNEQHGRFECSANGGAYEPCPMDGYSDGANQTLRVRARDASGNTDPTPAVRTWRRDYALGSHPNNAPQTAQAISGSAGRVTGTLVNGFGGGWPVALQAGSGGAHWYAWTAPETGRVTFSTAGSTADTVLGAVRGRSSVNTLRVGDDDDGGPGRSSELSFTARKGVVYSIGVAGFRDAVLEEQFGFHAAGPFELGWTFSRTLAPVPATGSPTLVRETTARLHGTVDPNGSPTSYRFEHGPTGAYGSSTPAASAGAGAGLVTIKADLSGLSRNKSYHYRLVATNAHGTAYGEDRVFKTAASRPGVEALYPLDVTETTARIEGIINPHAGETTYRFDWGKKREYGPDLPYEFSTPSASAGAGIEPVGVSATLTGLRPGTMYRFYLTAANGAGRNGDGEVQFVTRGAGPSAETLSPIRVTARSATLRAEVNPRYRETTVRFQYGTTTAYGSLTSPWSTGSGDTTQLIEGGAVNLQPATTYHARVVATSSGGTSYGQDITFTTRPSPPGADTTGATGVEPLRARLNGIARPYSRAGTSWFELGTTTDYGRMTPERLLTASAGTVAASDLISGLRPGTTYHARLVVETDAGRTAGDDVTFTTPAAR